MLIRVVDRECLGANCAFLLLVHVAHLSFCCDRYMTAHFVVCEFWPPSEVASVNYFAPGGDYRMSHGCMIEFYEFRCCVTLKNSAGQTIGDACFIDDVGVGWNNVFSSLRYERYAPQFGWDVAPPS